MSFVIIEFVKSMTRAKILNLPKADLFVLADYFSIDVDKAAKKGIIQNVILDDLANKELIRMDSTSEGYDDGRTHQTQFDREIELLKFQSLEKEREREFELEKQRLDREERERERQFQLEKLDRERRNELDKIGAAHQHVDVSKFIRFVPRFRESEIDTYFDHFEKTATHLKWPIECWTTLLQSVLVGKAHEAYAALSLSDSASYELVKETILKTYELVPEAYRQKFRNYKKYDNQTYVEFARVKETAFDRWCTSKKVDRQYTII